MLRYSAMKTSSIYILSMNCSLAYFMAKLCLEVYKWLIGHLCALSNSANNHPTLRFYPACRFIAKLLFIVKESLHGAKMGFL